MSFRIRSVIALALALTLAPLVAGAQIIVEPDIPPRLALAPARHYGGGAVMYGQPLGEFGDNVRRGFGLDGAATFGIDSRGIFGLRGEVGYLQYSSKSEPFRVSNGFSLIELESETKSDVLTLGIGPQLSAPAGQPIRPYVAATVGFARFATETAIKIPSRSSNTGEAQTLDQQTVSSDFILSLAGTGGVQFELGFLGRSGILADVGARYHRNGQARYVTSEGVKYTGTGRPTVTATESDADFIVYRVGISVPIR